MNLKKKAIYLLIALCSFTSSTVYSQGFFKNDATTSEETAATNSGVLRDSGSGDPNDPGPGGNGGAAPVGEGLAILSLLSGGYFMLKKRNSKK